MGPKSNRLFPEMRVLRASLGIAAAFGLAAASCTLDNPDAPELTGPSERARSIEVRAVPDQLTADGWSSAVIEAVLRGPNSERISGGTVQFDIGGFVDLGNLAPLNGPRPTYGGVEAGPVSAVTDGDGVARARYWAPFRTDQPDDTTVTILARELGTNAREITYSQADIFLRAADRPFPGPIPTPEPGCDAPSAEIALSGLCASGEARTGATIRASGLGSDAGEGAIITTYIFDWGDGTVNVLSSALDDHQYGSSLNGSSVTIQLTVINSCGASASTTEEAELVGVCP